MDRARERMRNRVGAHARKTSHNRERAGQRKSKKKNGAVAKVTFNTEFDTYVCMRINMYIEYTYV